MAQRKARPRGNFVSEWFGHRVYPMVVANAGALSDQRGERCPFLSQATGEDRRCIKGNASKGICTINSASNRVRQDWLVCPYRALNPDLVNRAVHRLFRLPDTGAAPAILPAVNLHRELVREDVATRLGKGELVFIYFDVKLGGELSIPESPRSPELSFDVTIVELIQQDGIPHIGRFGILEIQTMDFHGSYRAAVRNLRDGLRMHGERFAGQLEDNQHWLAEGVEGPNIANVFKRTFYQMMFKFQLGQHDRCAGCVLALPQSVWDSWQKHLGEPELTMESDGSFSLLAPDHRPEDGFPAWIYVFDTNPVKEKTPSPIVLTKMIGTDAPSISYWALEVAPAAARSKISSEAGLLAALARRLKPIWPELAKTVAL